jgi:hypothetical protein
LTNVLVGRRKFGINILDSLLASELATMDVKQTLQELEQRLLTNAVRQDAREVPSLLADEFREFGSSGRTFSKAEIVDLLQSESSVCFSLKSFEAYPVSEQAVLVTFRAVKEIAGSPPAESFEKFALGSPRWTLANAFSPRHQGSTIKFRCAQQPAW